MLERRPSPRPVVDANGAQGQGPDGEFDQTQVRACGWADPPPLLRECGPVYALVLGDNLVQALGGQWRLVSEFLQAYVQNALVRGRDHRPELQAATGRDQERTERGDVRQNLLLPKEPICAVAAGLWCPYLVRFDFAGPILSKILRPPRDD